MAAVIQGVLLGLIKRMRSMASIATSHISGAEKLAPSSAVAAHKVETFLFNFAGARTHECATKVIPTTALDCSSNQEGA
jgi:hypothetical protein